MKNRATLYFTTPYGKSGSENGLVPTRIEPTHLSNLAPSFQPTKSLDIFYRWKYFLELFGLKKWSPPPTMIVTVYKKLFLFFTVIHYARMVSETPRMVVAHIIANFIQNNILLFS